MKRPRIWLRWVVALLLILAAVEYVALTRIAPRHIIRAIERTAGGALTVDSVHLTVPFTTSLSGLRFAHSTSQAALSIQQVVIWPQWLAIPSRTLWLEAMQVDRPFVRLTRAKDGTVFWPTLPASSPSARGLGKWLPPSWKIHTGSVRVTDGGVEVVDEAAPEPFRLLFDHLSLVIGPLATLDEKVQMSFAIRGELVGFGGHSAPLLCSGWINPGLKELDATCQLKPLALAAFEPYYHGGPEVRVYTSTVAFTARVGMRNGQLRGRIQLELGNLNEGDLSVHGRTLMDVKRLTAGQQSSLRGELILNLLIDPAGEWSAEFVPGDEQVQQWVQRLVDRGVQVVRIPIWGKQKYLNMNLIPASKAVMTDIEAASKEIGEALEILAVPVPEPVLEVAPQPIEEPVSEPLPSESMPIESETPEVPAAPNPD
ncbi:MAG: DUF748 domain-containing protein [Candidatus Omnitrophica bacterium]|nr:DUF748 domain-containing protein [Candidatus Omnitrophota bacterium]